MKNSQQKGFTTLILIIIILLGIIGWLYFKKQQAQPVELVPETERLQSTTTSITPKSSTPAAPTQSGNKLTEQDIIGATYTISANFNGKKTAPQNVKLPYVPAGSENKERLYINPDGSVVNDGKSGGEMFYISNYEFTDSTQSEVTVYVVGNFGASGYDNRTYIVTKVDGQVVTKEILRF